MAENRDAYAVAFTAYQQLRERVYKHLKSLKDLESHGKADPDPKQLDCSWCEEQNILQSCLEAEKEKIRKMSNVFETLEKENNDLTQLLCKVVVIRVGQTLKDEDKCCSLSDDDALHASLIGKLRESRTALIQVAEYFRKQKILESITKGDECTNDEKAQSCSTLSSDIGSRATDYSTKFKEHEKDVPHPGEP